MKISIAMATYNGAKYLREQLDSFLTQERLPDELIVCDDCSTDETFDIVYSFARTAPFEVFHHANKERLGYVANFSQALSKTSGDLVFISDQDDVWFRQKIAFMERLVMEEPKYLLYMNDAALTDSELNGIGLTKFSQFRRAGYGKEVFVTGCCSAVRRELINYCVPVPKGFKGHDRWLANFADGMNLKFVSERVLQYYRRHDSNASSSISNASIKLSRWNGFFHRVESALADRGGEAQERVQRRLFIDGIERALDERTTEYQRELENLLAREIIALARLDERVAIRCKPLWSRVPAIGVRLIKGEYALHSGMLSALRDLMG